jgi:uncharacterized protein
MPEILKESGAEIERICRKYHVTELQIFGSQVRGDATAKSDFDFLIKFSADAAVSFLTLGRIEAELAEIVGRDVDLVPKDGLKKLIRRQVLEEAEIVYAA